jgi:hypothetical protein
MIFSLPHPDNANSIREHSPPAVALSVFLPGKDNRNPLLQQALFPLAGEMPEIPFCLFSRQE